MSTSSNKRFTAEEMVEIHDLIENIVTSLDIIFEAVKERRKLTKGDYSSIGLMIMTSIVAHAGD